MQKYKAISKLDSTEVSIDQEDRAKLAIKEGWIDSYEAYDYEEPPPPPEPTPAEKREAAYRVEADPIKEKALAYRTEADAWLLFPDEAKAAEVREWANTLLAQYLEKKQEIRERFPDEPEAGDALLERFLPPAEDDESAADGEAAPAEAEAAPAIYLLANSGIYHRPDCYYATLSNGDSLTLPEIAASRPDARPCQHCQPPELPAGEEE